jgi:hypothetical protein
VVKAVPTAVSTSLTPPKAAAAANSEAAIRSFVDGWVDAQNQADFARYETLYAEAFQGVKRVGSRTERYNRLRWLADRRGLFEKKPKVTIDKLTIVDLDETIAVRFEQTYESGSFRDVGPKQLVLTRADAGLRIAREEMLTSFPTPPAHVLGFPAFAFVVEKRGRTFVILEDTNAKPGRAEYVDEELAVAEFEDPATLPEGRRDLVGREIVLAGSGGELCRVRATRLLVVARAEPHFGQVSAWRGEDGAEKAKPAAIAKELFALAGLEGRNVGVEVAAASPACRGALYARAAEAAAPTYFTRRAPTPSEKKRALAAFAKLPVSLRNQKRFEAEKHTGAWTSFTAPGAEVQAYEARGESWITVSVRVGESCADYSGEGFALFHAAPDGTLALATEGDYASAVTVGALSDLDADGVPEVVSRDFILFQAVAGHHVPTLRQGPPAFWCGC